MTTSVEYSSDLDNDKTAAPSLDLEKGASDVQEHEGGSLNEKHDDRSQHPDHDFLAEEHDDIPAAVAPPDVAIDDYPDGGFTAWLVVLGVGVLLRSQICALTIHSGRMLDFFYVSSSVRTYFPQR